MKTTMKKLGGTLAGLLLIALYASLSMKADIGISAYDALSRTIGLASGIKMGTASIMLNTLLVLAQAIILGKKTKPKLFSQFIIVFGFGFLVNFIYYDLFASLELIGYGWQLAVLALALEVRIIGVLILFKTDFVTCPIDGISMELSLKTGARYEIIRQGMEVVSLVLICTVTLLYRCQWTIGIGTILDAISIAPLMALNKRIFKFLDDKPKEKTMVME